MTDQCEDWISPKGVISEVAAAVPSECLGNIVIVGSLAAGYRFFSGDAEQYLIQTKDVDCVIRPRIAALSAGKEVTEHLFEGGWTYHPTEEFPEPGKAGDEKLPVVRLKPPTGGGWFLELLTVPEDEDDFGRRYLTVETGHGHFSLCSFGGIALTEFDPLPTPEGIAIARPEMMALSNMLHHPEIGEQRMSGLFAGRSIKRSNKDLGRVLALAYLDERRDADALMDWGTAWKAGLRECFPETCEEKAHRAGDGIRALLESPDDLEEAVHTCQYGLLASMSPSFEALQAAGARLVADAIEPLESTS